MEKYWYVITTTEINDKSNRQYIGTSPLSEKELIDAFAKHSPIIIEELIYVSIGGETKNYSDDWEPHPNRVLLNPKHIISILPLKENWLEYKKSWDGSLMKKVEDFFSTLKG